MYKLGRLVHTIKYLKFKQVYFRFFYTIRKKFRQFTRFQYKLTTTSFSIKLLLQESIFSLTSCTKSNNDFEFLNKSHTFKAKIDWNFPLYGKLWTYNLTYFDYLHQENMTKENGLTLINDFIDQINSMRDALEPFPISLRGMNWIKFLSKYEIKDQKIDDSLYAQHHILIDNLEYHLLGNHLLENGFSLLLGAYYFQDEKFYLKAKKILIEELNEQILKDGAHFELSPMYHQLMLFRLLDCINMVKNNNWKNQELLTVFTSKAEMMLGWLNVMTYDNGDIPLLNDSTNNIAPTSGELNQYANRLDIKTKEIVLSDSGYRKIKKDRYEMIVDVGNIGPDYIPGHAHSDTFNFELYVDRKPFIVDTGLSTYESNDRRQLERSTKSHNTIEIDGENQSEVWGGFRVAKRAKIIDLKESTDSTIAMHDGYKRKKVLHTRQYVTKKEKITIIDTLDTKNKHQGVGYIHFHPSINVKMVEKELICNNVIIICSGKIELIEYNYSPEFNTEIRAQCAKISFSNELHTEIIIK